MHFWHAFLACISPTLKILHAFCLIPKMVAKCAFCDVKCKFWLPGPSPRECIFSRVCILYSLRISAKNCILRCKMHIFSLCWLPPGNAYLRNLATFESFYWWIFEKYAFYLVKCRFWGPQVGFQNAFQKCICFSRLDSKMPRMRSSWDWSLLKPGPWTYLLAASSCWVLSPFKRSCQWLWLLLLEFLHPEGKIFPMFS